MDQIKENLIQERERINEAFLKFKQYYNASPDSKEIYLFVEGKDDSVFYYCKTMQMFNNKINIRVIIAGNRKKVVSAYNTINWTDFAMNRVLFFIDRDLSDFTGEETPRNSNVYLTDKYAIENDYCCKETYINSIRVFGGQIDLDSQDESALVQFFGKSSEAFLQLMLPLMGRILYWRKNNVICQLNNFDCKNLFCFSNCTLIPNSQYDTSEKAIQYLHTRCNVVYEPMNTDEYIEELCSSSTPESFTRGKQVAQFFNAIVSYTFNNSCVVLPSKKALKPTISIGDKNFISQLASIMMMPQSLIDFLERNLRAFAT